MSPPESSGDRESATAPTIAAGAKDEIPASNEPLPEVSGYEIRRELARGGMGVVYEAVQTSLGRRVALKMVLAGRAVGEELVRFKIEAEAVARLHHPNIVQIYEVGEALGRPFFSLEYVDGGNLEDVLGGKPMPWREAAKLLAVVARAIHAAHLRGIIHRDLKPANILLTADRTPKIADFGIAKRLDADKQTETGKMMGTPSYMAPEQALGRIDQLGPRTDLFALGAILYDALTGRPPFDGETTLQTVMALLREEPISPRTLQPSLPLDLETICLKCLQKDPDKRYESALELAEDLERLLRNEPIQARPIGRIDRSWRWARRKPAGAALLVVSVAAFVGGLAAWGWFTGQLQRELKATELARRDAATARDELRLRLVRAAAERIDRDLIQLAGVPRVMAAALGQREDWSEAQLTGWVSSTLAAEPLVFGMAVAFEPDRFRPGVADYALYVHREGDRLETKQLLPPEYTPIYREWEWYRDAPDAGRWSEPYVDEGGGDIPMVTFSVPFHRDGERAGVVTADLSLEYFRALADTLRDSRFGGVSQAFVVTGKGTVLGHPDAARSFPAPGAKALAESEPGWKEIWPRISKGEPGEAKGVPLGGPPASVLFAPVVSARWSCVAVVGE